jgi:tungstate transport system substrate-binding protein
MQQAAARKQGTGWCAALLLIFFALYGQTPRAEAEILRIAASPSLSETGFLNYLSALASADGGFALDWRALEPQEAIASARRCEADALLIDSPDEESRFMSEGAGALRFFVMYADFLILGPPDDPAGVLRAVAAMGYGAEPSAGDAGVPSAVGADGAEGVDAGAPSAAALAAIARAGKHMVSSGADPAVFRVEGRLWNLSGERAEAKPWYLDPGRTALESLKIAEQRQAYIIVSRQTWLERGAEDSSGSHCLSVIVEGDKELRDQFSLIAVNPEACGKTRLQEALRLLRWIGSPRAQALIGRFTWHGFPLYIPDAGAETCPTCH